MTREVDLWEEIKLLRDIEGDHLSRVERWRADLLMEKQKLVTCWVSEDT